MTELQYKKIDMSFAESLLNIWADADVIRYTNMKLPCSLEDVKNRIAIFMPFDVFAVIQNEEVIGVIGCPPFNEEKSQYGLFYQFCKSSWGQGNATIAAMWLIDYMKQKYNEATLFADVVVDNVASERILKKFGFQQISEELIERDGLELRVHNYKLVV